MRIFKGTPVCKGTAYGRLFIPENASQKPCRRSADSPQAEIERLKNAASQAEQELSELSEDAENKLGNENAAVFGIHAMILADGDLLDKAQEIILSQSVNAEYAISEACCGFETVFSEMDNEYMNARASDIRDIGERLIRLLSGRKSENMPDFPFILLTNELSPAQAASLDTSKVLAIVTSGGSSNSHASIIARSLGIPTIIGCDAEISPELNGKYAAADGNDGTFYVEPSEDMEKRLKMQISAEKNEREQLAKLKYLPTITADGRKVMLYSNISSPDDIDTVLKNGSEGVGLFRSEFLFLGRTLPPSEEEQFEAYKKAAEALDGKRLIIRTLDIGADKQADYFGIGSEENPALGLRAIRLCLAMPDIFRTQLRAVFRAAAFGNVSVMYPMITSADELLKARKTAQDVLRELAAEGIPFADAEQGSMIETPAAVVISDMLAMHCDFFSIGTNDLIQYTLAADRQNSRVEKYCDPHHPAVLRMIEHTVQNAHKAGIWAGICGELAADTSLTEAFVNMGVDELSVTPSATLPLRKLIRDIRL